MRYTVTMRILHLTDTHRGLRGWALGAPPGWSRADDHARAMALALEHPGVDLVIHTGDLFDRSQPPPCEVERVVAELRALSQRVPVVLMPGNHDRRGLLRSLSPGPNLHVLDAPTRLVVAGIALAVVPFQASAPHWAAAARHAVGGGVDLLLAHQAFHGHVVPGLVFRAPNRSDTIGEAHLPPGVSHVLCGHIHPRQVVEVGAATVVCPGSTARTAFSEARETKGYALWELGRTVSHRFVDLPSRPMVWVQEPSDLVRVAPEALVRAGSPELEAAAAALGGWVVPTRHGPPSPPPVRRATQLGLFATAR